MISAFIGVQESGVVGTSFVLCIFRIWDVGQTSHDWLRHSSAQLWRNQNKLERVLHLVDCLDTTFNLKLSPQNVVFTHPQFQNLHDFLSFFFFWNTEEDVRQNEP